MVFGLFGRAKPAGLDLKNPEAVNRASPQQIFDAIGNVKESVPSGAMVDVTRRCIDIIYADESVTHEDRHVASVILEHVVKMVEKVFAQNPEALKAYQNAYTNHIQDGRRFGVGSLAWKISRLQDNQKVSEIIDRNNAHLLADFPKEQIAEARSECIRALIRDRVPAKVDANADIDTFVMQKLKHANGVNILGWLVLTRDPTAIWLLSDEEKRTLSRYLIDYESARELLVQLQVISISRPLNFTPIPDPSMVVEVMLLSSAERNAAETEPSRGDTRETLLVLDREAREGFHTIMVTYRLFVWQKLLQGTYGDRFYSEIVAAAKTKTEALELIAKMIDHFNQLYEVATDPSKAISFDDALLANVMYDHLDKTLPKRKLDEMVQACSKVLRDEMFYFPPYARYLLRYLIHGQAKAIEALIEDPLI
jgi:hypothetical protein